MAQLFRAAELSDYVGDATLAAFFERRGSVHELDDGIPQFSDWAPKAVLHQRGSRQV